MVKRAQRQLWNGRASATSSRGVTSPDDESRHRQPRVVPFASQRARFVCDGVDHLPRRATATLLVALVASSCTPAHQHGDAHTQESAGGSCGATAGFAGEGSCDGGSAGAGGASALLGAGGSDAGSASLPDCPAAQDVAGVCGIPNATYPYVTQCEVPFPRDWEPSEPMNGCGGWPRDPQLMTVLVDCEVVGSASESGSGADYDAATDSILLSGALCTASLATGVRVDLVFGCGTTCL